MVRFLHAADLHLDAPFRALAAREPALAERFQLASQRAFTSLCDAALMYEVDFLVIAGDIYDQENKDPTTQIRFLRGMQRLAKEGIPVVFVNGNHDPYADWTAPITWPERIHHLRPDRVQVQAVRDRDGKAIAQVCGVSYRHARVDQNLVGLFEAVPPTDLPSIGLLHTNCDRQPGTTNLAPCSLADLTALEDRIDYWALGHVHDARVLHPGHPTVAYSGNLQARHFGEPGPKGAYLVELEKHVPASTTFVPMDDVRFLHERANIQSCETLQQVQDRVRLVARRLLDGQDGRSLVLRLDLVGRSALHHQLLQPEVLPNMEADLNLGHDSQEPWVWLDQLVNHTQPDLNLESLAKAPDVVGALLREVKQVAAKPDELRQLLEEARQDLPQPPTGALPEDWAQGEMDLLQTAEWQLLNRLSPPPDAS